jgi:RNA polymerase sigma factor (sigma-70 family)
LSPIRATESLILGFAMPASAKHADLLAQLDGRWRSPLMSFFLRRVPDRATAEDLTQDVFERLLKTSERAEIEDIEALIFVTAGNLLKDRGRKSLRRSGALLQNVDSANVSAVTHEFLEDRNPERVFLARETIGEVLRALDELGQRTRDIYILFKLEGMKQSEIARLMGVTRSVVEKDVMRAKAHLTLRFGRQP